MRNARRVGSVALVAAVLALAGVGYVWYASRTATDILRPDDALLVERGQEVYRSHCASCHGVRLEGQPEWRRPGPGGRLPAPPHDATGHSWHHPDAFLVRLTREGPAALVPGHESDMPGFAGVLPDTDIVAVLSYIKSSWPSEIRAAHDRINAQAH
jgi:mono/diheme cytochrome c family protein